MAGVALADAGMTTRSLQITGLRVFLQMHLGLPPPESMAVRGPWSDMTYTDRALCRAQGHGVAHCHLSQIRALDPQQGDEPTSEWTALGTVNAAVQVIAVMVTAVIAMKIEAGAGAGAEFIAWMPQGNNLEKLIVYRTSVSY
ncbi:hypothetical protein KXV81_002772 [Aspergillus fumigatus]|jgi:hypothetical protein|nr:hypothetical protein KXX48_005352 [Aspergillus fumigatus]KMK57991.1 hypothetical protein Y699_03411 [Aspergillus fumigatus Z5]KAH1350866.1 hypothetical protein KXX63_003686 [Aspergillus fumigatus]KAH1561471.1 hypothetical protein KXX17_005026 [Aspergillus fumigatus]KAH1770759.1 hypothetical protein KXX07_002952 [Aspergillus fumigatus]